jgi:mRNA interferase HigB
MQILNKDFLKEIIDNPVYKKAKPHLLSWVNEVEADVWENPNQLKAKYRNASILKKSRVIFNISGNNFRLIADINYEFSVVYVKWFGTHAEYDKIDADAF